MSDREERREKVLAGVIDALSGLNGMLTGFVVAATFIDPEGQQRIYVDSGDEQPLTVTLGILEGMAAVERAKIVQMYYADDDE